MGAYTDVIDQPPTKEPVMKQVESVFRERLTLRAMGGSPRTAESQVTFNLYTQLLADGKPLREALSAELSQEGRVLLSRHEASFEILENAFKNLANYHALFLDVNRRLSSHFGVGPSPRLVPSEIGQSLHQALGRKRPEFQAYEKILARHLPHKKGIQFNYGQNEVQLGATEEGISEMIPAEGWSTGTSHLSMLLGPLVFMPEGSMVMIEEPELSLHPAAIRKLMEDIHAVVDAGRAQFFITTHSPIILEDLDPKQKDHGLWRFGRNKDGSASALICDTESKIEDAHLSLSGKE